MYSELFNLLPPYGQILLTLVVLTVGGFAAWRGLVDRPKSTEPSHAIPMYFMVGPMHDALQSIHGMAEDNRTRTAIMRDVDKTLTRIDLGTAYTHRLLEEIVRNQEMREDYVPPSSRKKV
jgi:hypothetical protein